MATPPHWELPISCRTIDDGFRIVASFPELKDKPIVIGESDPEGCAACQGPQAPAYRNGDHVFQLHGGQLCAKTRAGRQARRQPPSGVDLGLRIRRSSRTSPAFARWRRMELKSPCSNVFRMFSRMGAERIAATSDSAVDLDTIVKQGVRERPDVTALASRDSRRATILIWHYHDDDVPGPAAEVSLVVEGLGVPQRRAKLQHFRIDGDHGNAYTAWRRMGSPQPPSSAQYAELEKASELATLKGPMAVDIADGRATMRFMLPRQGVSLVVLEW